MSDKRYKLVYLGKLKPGMDAATVKSNLVLSIGISEAKAEQLVQPEPKMLKHFSTAVEAQRLAEKFDQAGIVCAVRDSIGSSGVDTTSGESSLLSVLKKQANGTEEESSSVLNRQFNERQRNKRA